jgi:hypothetical protein
VKVVITRDEILMGRDREYPLSPELEHNLAILLMRINILRQWWGNPMCVTSGYRPGKYNVKAGGAKNSAHLHCMAIDVSDPNGKLGRWLAANLPILRACDLWMENPENTKGWCHLDIRDRGDSNRIFKP